LDPDSSEDFSVLLSRALVAKGWRPQRLAARLGRTRQTVSYWTNGDRVPDDETVVAIENLLNRGQSVVTPGLLRATAERHRRTRDRRHPEARDLAIVELRDQSKRDQQARYQSLDHRLCALEDRHRRRKVDPGQVQSLVGELQSFLVSLRQGSKNGQTEPEITTMTLSAIDRVLTIDPSWRNVLLRDRAQLHASAARWEDALHDFEAVQDSGPLKGEDLFTRAQLLVNLGQLFDAAAIIRPLATYLPEDPSASFVESPIDPDDRTTLRFH
jgi:transcriptional regulator with XRE-family HTH domain